MSECGNFKLERFIIGEHEAIHDEHPWPERFRVLKRTPEWWGEIAPSEPTLALAKHACEGVMT